MNGFEKNITQYWKESFPNVWSFLWSPEEARKIPIEHKYQIHFLSKEGTELVNRYLEASKMTRYFPYLPFKEHFKKIDKFHITEGCSRQIKKWLHDRAIPVSQYVFVSNDRSGQAIMLTWKMVLEYWEGLFFAEDITIFDSSLDWGLFYYHEGDLFFGTKLVVDIKAKK